MPKYGQATNDTTNQIATELNLQARNGDMHLQSKRDDKTYMKLTTRLIL